MFVATRTHIGIKWYTDNDGGDSPYTGKEIGQWIVGTLGFLFSYNETLTGPQLAQRLSEHISLDNPKARWAYNWLNH